MFGVMLKLNFPHAGLHGIKGKVWQILKTGQSESVLTVRTKTPKGQGGNLTLLGLPVPTQKGCRETIIELLHLANDTL